MKELNYVTTNILPSDTSRFINASDETLADLKSQCEQRDKENSEVHRLRVAEYRKAQEAIATLWGRKSKQYKYFDKQSISGFQFSITGFYVQAFERQMSHRKKELDEAEQNKKRKERTQAATEAHDKEVRECLKIALRYELDEESDYYDLLMALLEKDKYLALAYQMEQVRNDWNDGCGSVRSALRDFEVDTEQDKLIHIDVSECCEDFEDGRVFRDTEWSYDKLYNLADKQLATDVHLLSEYLSDW